MRLQLMMLLTIDTMSVGVPGLAGFANGPDRKSNHQ